MKSHLKDTATYPGAGEGRFLDGPTMAAGNPDQNANRARGPPQTDILTATTYPVFASIEEAAKLLCVSKWLVREKIAIGELEAKKAGRRTLVTMVSILRYAENLPAARLAKPVRKSRHAEAAQ
jgi:excisionase family DNA binding protein